MRMRIARLAPRRPSRAQSRSRRDNYRRRNRKSARCSGAFTSPVRRGNALDHGFQHLVDADARSWRETSGAVLRRPDRLRPRFRCLTPRGRGAGQVDLVDDRHDFKVVIQRHVDVGQRLRLHALRRVHHQQRALARRQRAGDLVGKVDVAGRVDQVERIGFARPALDTACARPWILMVMPRSRSSSIESSTCSTISRCCKHAGLFQKPDPPAWICRGRYGR